MKIYDKKEEERFANLLLLDTVYFHKLYAKWKDPVWLQITRNVGEAHSKIKRRIETL